MEEWRRRKPVSCIAANVRAWQQLLHGTFAAGNGDDGQEKSRQNRQMQRVAEWQHPKRVIRRGATSILWVVCVSVGYVVRIWRLYMRSQSATKNSQQNVK